MTHQLRKAVLALAAAAALVANVACAPDPGSGAPATRTAIAARGWVDVEGGLLTVRAPLDGVVAEVNVREGERVQVGQILASLNDELLRSQLSIARAEVLQSAAQIDSLRARLPQLRSAAERMREAALEGAAPGNSAAEAGVSTLVAEADLRAAVANASVLRQRQRDARRQLNAAQIHAPVSGIIVRALARAGDHVAVSLASPLFQVLPDSPQIVRAEVDEGVVDRIGVGRIATVVAEMDDGSPHTARVLRISPMLGPAALGDSPADRIDRHAVECVLQLDGPPLRVGQRVLVRFGG